LITNERFPIPRSAAVLPKPLRKVGSSGGKSLIVTRQVRQHNYRKGMVGQNRYHLGPGPSYVSDLYRVSPPSPQQLTIRTSRTSFQYARPTADGDPLIGRVKAIADGALILKTNKSKDEEKYCVWSKQRCAISFEVII